MSEQARTEARAADQQSPGRPSRRFRPVWVLGFTVGALPLIPLIFATLLSSEYLPWLIVSGALTFVCGYEIWHQDHPRESARREIATRVAGITSVLAGAVALAFSREHPELVLGGIALLILVLLSIFILLWSAERGFRTAAGAKTGPNVDPAIAADREPPAR